MDTAGFATHFRRLHTVRSAMPRAILTVICSITACMGATAATVPSDPVAEVTRFERQLEQGYNSPEFSRDPSVALAYFDATDAMLLWDIMLPTQYRGSSFRKHFVEIGNQFQDGKVEFLDMEVTADENLAFVTSFQHFAGIGKDGKPFDMTMRVTDCLRKANGKWRIVHEHVSIPLDSATFMSLTAPKH